MKRNLISMLDVKDDLDKIIDLAIDLKNKSKSGKSIELLIGKTLGMIFEKSSTRTRVSFEVGMTKLGGHAIFLSTNDIQLGRGETIEDTALVLSRYCDIIMYRAKSNQAMKELAKGADVPVMYVAVKRIAAGWGLEKWGAEQKIVYIIFLGKVLSHNNCEHLIK